MGALLSPLQLHSGRPLASGIKQRRLPVCRGYSLDVGGYLLMSGSKQRPLPMCRGEFFGRAHEILQAVLVSSLAVGSELHSSAGYSNHLRLHDVVLSLLLIRLVMRLTYANLLSAVRSLLMLPINAGKVARGSEQLSFTAFAMRSSWYDMISITGVLVYVLLVSSVAFVLLESNSAQDCRAIGIAAFTSFRLRLGNFDAEAYVDGQNATVVFVVTICFVNIVLLNMLILLMIYTWTLQQSGRALLGLRGGAQLLNECVARMSSKASARADWFPKCQHVLNEASTQGVDRTTAALQLQVIVQGRTRMIDALPTTTAAQLERIVVERVGFDGFGLYYRGRPLHGSTVLSNFGLTRGATIELKERGRGGGCSQSKSSTVDIEELVPAVVEAGRTSHITHATIDEPESVATELRTAALEPTSYRERHDARDRELGVSEEALRSICARKVIQGKLVPYNFESLWSEKRASHLQGTREWAFEEIEQWRQDESASKLFWLMGGGGVGKSVLSAELLARWLDKRCVAAWHFCRHDDTDQSKPANLLRSIAAMLCHTLDGFEEALNGATGLEDALVSADPSVVFDVLIHKPFEKVPSQTSARVIMVDALDEIPKEGQKPLLDVIVNQLASLPTWLRVFVTSREEPLIQKALSAFRPKELRADEAKNRADVEVFLRTIAREHVKGQANMSDVAKAVERQFKINLSGEALSSLQEKMDESRAIYDLAARKLKTDPKLRELEHVNEMREPKPKQLSSEFETIYAWAERAQQVLEESVASEWEEDHVLKGLKHPKADAKKNWVSKADSPGVKGKDRAAEKCHNDYDGDAAHLKDVARLTLLFDSFQQMIDGLEALRSKCGFKVVAIKNKFAHPTPMGYRDLNLCVEVPIDEETRYIAWLPDEHPIRITFARFCIRFVCEVQINHSVMIEAKAKAHKPYEHIRSELPKLCKGTGVDADKLEAFIVGQLNSSALDVAVSALSAKAQGLFIYAFMLQQYLDGEAKASRTIRFDNLDTLPAGLDDVYAVNFRRAFPTDAPERWVTAKPLIELVAATMEPISVAMAASLLGWTADEQALVLELTALLFPVRDGLIHVFHKTVIDWITGDVSESSSIKTGASDFRVQRDEGHRRFAEGFTRWLQGDANEHYWLKHGIVHLCRAGRADDAVRVYSSDLSFLRRRLDAGLLGTVSTDYLELRRYVEVDLTHATQMKSFVGKHYDVFERERGSAVTQLASQQPDKSVVFRALAHQEKYLKWYNKPQAFDPCIATLLHSRAVTALSASRRRIVGAAGGSVHVYDAATEELLETLDCREDVCTVAIYQEHEAGSIAAGLRDGGIKILDAATLVLKREESNVHSGPIYSVAFSPDGKAIVSGSRDQTIKVLDSATLELMLEKRNAHSGPISCVAFSPDGKTIVSGSDDRTIKVWDFANTRPFNESEWEEIDISAMPKDRYGSVKVEGLGHIKSNYWRSAITGEPFMEKPSAGTLELKAKTQNTHKSGFSTAIASVQFSPDGTKILSAGFKDRKIKIWDAGTLEIKAETQNAHTSGFSGSTSSVQFSPDGTKIVSAGIEDKTIKIWDAATLELKAKESNAHSHYIRSVAYSQDGKTILSSSDDRTIKVWDSATLELRNVESNAHTGPINSLAFSPDGKTIVSGSDDETIKIWDSATLELKREQSNAHRGPICSVAFSPNGKTITSASLEQTIKVWDSATLELKAEKNNAHMYRINSVAFSPDGKTIVSGSDDKRIKVWDSANLELTSEKSNAHTDAILSVAFSPDGKAIVSGSSDQAIKVWDCANFRPFDNSEWEERYGERHDEGYYSEIKYWYNTITGDIRIEQSDAESMWTELERCSLLGTLELKAEIQCAHLRGSSGSISSVQFSPDGTKIVSAGIEDKTIKVWVFLQPIWDAAALELKSKKSSAHSGPISSVAFSPDGKTIVSGSLDKTIKVWDTGTLQLVEELPGHATTYDKSGQVVYYNGSAMCSKEVEGVFHAPSPILRFALHEQRIAVGAQSGELYYLEVM